jgi:hypothetical protein
VLRKWTSIHFPYEGLPGVFSLQFEYEGFWIINHQNPITFKYERFWIFLLAEGFMLRLDADTVGQVIELGLIL